MQHLGTLFFAITLCCSYKITAQDTNKALKVMTYNILVGFDWGKDSLREDQVATWIYGKKPDVVALQELCGFTQAKLEKLAIRWGHRYAIILKTEDYPVGITSNRPFKVQEKLLDELWHGMLHVRTHGIDLFVVHLSPADRAFRKKEADIIAGRVKQLSAVSSQYIVLGDFNAHSPLDVEFDLKYPYALQRYRKSDAKNTKYKNLLNDQFDYGVMATFLSIPLIDVCQRHVPLDQRTTCPSPINVPQWLTAEEMEKTKERIDFILVSPELSTKCVGANIFNGEEMGYFSDHYPVEAVFNLQESQ